jgi:uncharacterized membrane protein HdeD (DUF308 family)
MEEYLMTAIKTKTSNAWVWSLIRGLIALGLGLFLVFSANIAPAVVIYALAAYLTIAGALQTFSGLFNRNAPGSRTDKIRGLVGLLGGLAVLLLFYFVDNMESTAFTLLAITLIVYGVLGLFEAFFDRGGAYFRWMPVIINALLAALGVLIFYFRAQELDLRLWGGVLLALIGVILLGYALLIQKQDPRPSADV